MIFHENHMISHDFHGLFQKFPARARKIFFRREKKKKNFFRGSLIGGFFGSDQKFFCDHFSGPGIFRNFVARFSEKNRFTIWDFHILGSPEGIFHMIFIWFSIFCISRRHISMDFYGILWICIGFPWILLKSCALYPPE